MNNELEYIKLKVDWYKSTFPWILTLVAGAVTFARSINSNSKGEFLVLIFIIESMGSDSIDFE
jgi:hypothetical protein